VTFFSILFTTKKKILENNIVLNTVSE